LIIIRRLWEWLGFAQWQVVGHVFAFAATVVLILALAAALFYVVERPARSRPPDPMGKLAPAGSRCLKSCPRERGLDAGGVSGKPRSLRLRQRVRNSLSLGSARAGLPPALERRIDPMDISDAYQDGGYRHSKCEQIAIFDWSDHRGGNDQAEAQHRQMREIDRV